MEGADRPDFHRDMSPLQPGLVWGGVAGKLLF